MTVGLLAGCATVASVGTGTGGDGAASTVLDAVAGTDATQDAAAVLAANDSIHEFTDDDSADGTATLITLAGDSASVDDSGADSSGVAVEGSTVTITASGTYRVSGALTDGQLLVNSTDEGTVRLILDDASITSSTSSAIDVAAAAEVVLVLAAGSTNSLSDTAGYADTDESNAALYSAADLLITGTGALNVTGNGNDGITGKDGLVIASGTVTVDAVDDGVRGKDYLVITGGTLAVTAGGDGLKSDNDEDTTRGFVDLAGGAVTVTAGDDGIQAQTDVVVTAGTLDITAGGGSSQAAAHSTAMGAGPADDTADTSDDSSTDDSATSKGITSEVITVIEGGETTIDAADDAVNSAAYVHVTGDATVAASAGDDGIHADTALVVDGGTVDITTSYEGLESADVTVAGGSTTVTSSDDGLNAAGASTAETGGGAGGEMAAGDYSIVISGGTLVVDADGDGLDSNGSMTITGGTTVVSGPTDNGNGALDVNGDFTISGGTLLAAGSMGMAVSPSTSSAQGWLSANLSDAVDAGTIVQVVAEDGSVVASFESSKSFQNLVYSSPTVTTGATYSIAVGGTVSGDVLGGLATSGTADGATVSTTLTAGEATQGGMGGGGTGGGPGSGTGARN